MSQTLNAAKKEVDKNRRRRALFLKQLFCNLHSHVSSLTIDCFSYISQHLKILGYFCLIYWIIVKKSMP